jgi:hypothetical protein
VFVGVVTSVKYSSELWTHWLAHYTNASLGFDRVPRANYIVIIHSSEARARPLSTSASSRRWW